MGKFLTKTGANNQFYFNLKADNGQTLLSSEGYSSKASCANGIDSVKENSADDKKFDRQESTNGKYYFRLKSGNGQVIGTSGMYESEASRDNGIESVKSNAPNASVEEE